MYIILISQLCHTVLMSYFWYFLGKNMHNYPSIFQPILFVVESKIQVNVFMVTGDSNCSGDVLCIILLLVLVVFI